jgi:pimeloyl-ACP methyl ester carboxylesterase
MIERRLFMTAAASIAATSVVSTAVAQSRQPLTFVLVHGAWHGGWCWKELANELRTRGHRVTAPTLTGLGERAHLLSPAVDLETHIADIVNHIDAEELKEIVLVGHSYGGFVIRGVASRRASLISHIAYLDAFVPLNGEMVISYVSPEHAKAISDLVAGNATGTMPALAPAVFGVAEPAQIDWVKRRLTPHPARTYLQPIALGPDVETIKSRHYIACMSPKLDVFDSTRNRIRQDASFAYSELDAGHDVMVTAPALLAETLLSRVG